MDDTAQILAHMLGMLRSAYILHQTSHWQCSGPMFYGDHLMLQRIYESVEDEIDTLAEKVVAKYGSADVSPIEQVQVIQAHVQEMEQKSGGNPIMRAMVVEQDLQETFENAYQHLKQINSMSLGLDDFIMSVANNHESNVYLLQQRLQQGPKNV